MSDITVKVSDFTLIPGPRFKASGDNSSEEFYLTQIKPVLSKLSNGILTIDFNGTWGYPPSFTSQLGIYLKKYFGGYKQVESKLHIISEDNPEVVERFWRQLKEENK